MTASASASASQTIVDESSSDAGRPASARVFSEIASSRRAVRKFRTEPVPRPLLDQVLNDAQWAPSNCNTQPWAVHILSGVMKDALSEAMIKDFDAQVANPDFTFDIGDYDEACAARAFAQGMAYHESLGVSRDDYEARQLGAKRNLVFFDAPHVVLLFMPSVGDNVRAAADMGMYAQTFMLALVANGLACIPQTMIGFYANRARALLDLPESMKLLFGISFGYEDTDRPGKDYVIGRIPISQSVHYHG